MNVMDAAYHAVHDYPGGSESLGPRVGISPAVLRNKVNPNCTTHHLTLQEADRILGVTGDMGILQALAAEHGRGLVLLGDAPAATSMMDAVLAEHCASGALASQLQQSLADGVITHRELDAIMRAGMTVQSAVVALVGHMSHVVRKPQVVS